MTMIPTDRREFLASSLFAAGAAALPAWLARWFVPQDPQGEQDPAKIGKAREDQLRAAVAKAKDQGKPLLVCVAPDDLNGADAWYRAEWFGAFLTHGGSLAVLEVALCVPACGNLDTVRRLTGAAPIEGSPLMLVVDVSQVGVADAAPPRVTPLVLDLGSARGEAAGRGDFDEVKRAAQQKRIEEGIAKLTAELHAALHRHGASTAKLIADARAKMTEPQRKALEAWVAGGTVVPSDELLVRAAAELRSRATELGTAARERVLASLTAAAERELVKKRIPGSRWATSNGCGTSIEPPAGEAQAMPGIACGMGSVPPLCDRFLEFYTHG